MAEELGNIKKPAHNMLKECQTTDITTLTFYKPTARVPSLSIKYKEDRHLIYATEELLEGKVATPV
jgi:hypothetical protein